MNWVVVYSSAAPTGFKLCFVADTQSQMSGAQAHQAHQWNRTSDLTLLHPELKTKNSLEKGRKNPTLCYDYLPLHIPPSFTVVMLSW